MIVSSALAFGLGQSVRRLDGHGVGTVIGMLLSPRTQIFVRWASGPAFESPEDLLEVAVPTT
jgi:hypothetical protein